MTLLERVQNSPDPEEEFETYQCTPSTGKGTFYYTDCGNHMYSVNGFEAYHGCLCPQCNWYRNKRRTLLMRGTPEANEYMKRTGKLV